MNVLRKPQGKEIQIDGAIYKLSPFNLYIWGELEDKLGASLSKIQELLSTKQAHTLSIILFVFLKDNHPDIKSPSDVGKLLMTVQDIMTATEAIAQLFNEFGVKPEN